MIHYTVYPIPSIFSSPSLVFTFNTEPNYLWNASIYCIFFLQHVIMASSSLKKAVVNFYPRYYLYERYIYNIFSSWTYLLILNFVEPLASPK